MGMLNFASITLGLIAWILPIVYLKRMDRPGHRKWVILSVISMGACSISFAFQIIYTHHLVKKEDWSSLLDTMGAVGTAAIILLLVTIGLNGLAMLGYYKIRDGDEEN
ncbi:hypothetical protein MKY41_18175 [Sporosarcina sp. FSL W7-1349]|uniref:hypothetical protein n=1 Tax=Sporosarcina sp. FSL W7-1349 TaxID=2921561 RepID=UPI0030F90A65